jgi:hypothetical protein
VYGFSSNLRPSLLEYCYIPTQWHHRSPPGLPGTVVRTIPLTVAGCGFAAVLRMSQCARTPIARGPRGIANCDLSGAQLNGLSLWGMDFFKSRYGEAALLTKIVTHSDLGRLQFVHKELPAMRSPSAGRVMLTPGHLPGSRGRISATQSLPMLDSCKPHSWVQTLAPPFPTGPVEIPTPRGVYIVLPPPA